MQNQNDTNREPNLNGQSGAPSGYPTQTRFVNMDSFVSFIGKKTEQIATALYLVSDTMESVDPIRHRIREKAVELVSTGKSLDLLSAVEKHFEFHALKVLVAEVETYLSISHIVGDISEMNKRILVGEGKKLVDAIDIVLTEERQHGFSNPTLADDATSNFMMNVFGADRVEPHVATGMREIGADQRQDAPTQTPSPQNVTKQVKNDAPSAIKSVKPMSAERSQNDIAIHHVRRQSIIKVIGQNKNASLTDIKAVITDVSEKTLQRELMSLIAEGVVLKTGDKRWARYSLA